MGEQDSMENQFGISYVVKDNENDTINSDWRSLERPGSDDHMVNLKQSNKASRNDDRSDIQPSTFLPPIDQKWTSGFEVNNEIN